MPTVVSVFGVQPLRIGGTETFARELSVQLGRRGWQSVLCFESKPSARCGELFRSPERDFGGAGKIRPALIGPRLNNWQHSYGGINPRFCTCTSSALWACSPGWPVSHPLRRFSLPIIHLVRPNYILSARRFGSAALVRLINYPITKVICVSKYGCHCMKTLDLLPSDRYELVYNAVDVSRVNADSRRAAEFRRRFNISDNKKIIVQVQSGHSREGNY